MVLLEKTFTVTPLLAVANKKPLDVGCGRLSASIGANGEMLSINGYHPRVGFMTLTPIAQFPGDQFYHTPFVRQYRRRLIDIFEREGRGFGLCPQAPMQDLTLSLIASSAPLFRYRVGFLQVSSLFLAVDVAHYGCLINQVEIYNGGEEDALFAYEFGGTLSLNRSSYGQITEAGPIPMPLLENALVVRDSRLSITNVHLPARADMFLFADSQPLHLTATIQTSAQPIDYRHVGNISLAKGETRVLSIAYTLTPLEEAPFSPDATALEEWTQKAKASLPQWKTGEDTMKSFLIQRNIDYILSCCTVPITEEHTCLITDHQILPLSWNRDIYYMVQLLYMAEREVTSLLERPQQQGWQEKVQQILKGHLFWTFEIAARPHRYWGRAYLTNGYCKDDVFQLDQQCYPLLELCDYVARFQDASLVRRVAAQLEEILSMLLDYRHEQRWLFMTRETPGDDRVAHPYHFSSQVLIWWTLSQLANLNAAIPFTKRDLAAWAEHVQRDCLRAFKSRHAETCQSMFAYLTDLQGNYQWYHDANDLPTVYAPLWGFCSLSDPIWQQTMQFGFSPQNTGGFYPGAFGGLGSVHAPNSWPLGDGQDLLYAHIQRDRERYEQILQKLTHVVQWDGLFSESIEKETGEVASRHWFSWPGAFIATILLKVDRERNFS